MAYVYNTSITSDSLREILHFDPCTGLFTWRIKPSRRISAGSVAGHIAKSGYVDIRINHSPFRAHRLAWLYVYGSWPNDEIDHIDGDRANNAIINLREAGRHQNCWNRVGNGFTYRSASKKFVAQIFTNGQYAYLGSFDRSIDARAAYLAASERLHGEFSTTRLVGV